MPELTEWQKRRGVTPPVPKPKPKPKKSKKAERSG